jgi:hypothetical protein
MRRILASALLVGAALTIAANTAEAGRAYRAAQGKDCTPTNGPFGFYGNLWCQPNDASYLRNLGAQWPQKTPANLRYARPNSTGSNW